MANRFDVVAVQIENKGSIIIRMVVWTYSGVSVIATAGGDRFTMKSVYGCPIRCCKGDMRTRLSRISPSDPEEGFGTDTVARELLALRI